MKTLMYGFVIAGLTACAAPGAQRDTYDMINFQLKKATELNAQYAQRDEAALARAKVPAMVPVARAIAEERFNLSFNEAPAQQFFRAIVTGTRYSMLVHPGVTGTISAHLKEVTLVEVMDSVREIYGYDYKIEGNRIYVRPLSLQTSIFQVNYLNSNRKGSSDIRVTSGSVSDVTSNGSGQASSNFLPQQRASSHGIDSSKISTSSNNDFWAELKASLEAIIGGKEGRSVVISAQSGVVVIRAMSDELRNVAAFLKATQLSVDRQVILEAKIMEVELNDSFQSGINWAAFAAPGSSNRRGTVGFVAPGSTLNPAPQNGAAPASMTTGGNNALTAISGSALSAAGTAAGSLFGLAFQTSNFSALISFLESQGTVHVLSSPRIATLNNQKAVLKVGTDEFFVTRLTTTPGLSAGNVTTGATTTVEVQPFFSGVSLDVTPQIDDSGNITLHVHPSVSKVTTVDKIVNLGANNGTLSLPLASSAISETDSVVRGQDGRVIAIGGLMRQSSTSDNSQVPGAGDVPVLGNLFRSTARIAQKRELVILIRPTVIQSNSDWAQDMLDSQRRVEELAPRVRPLSN
ncbi:secretin N-terminal domain-containing protein [Actimicrobium sp. CCC2.4]|uniref:secretin N-terminal domain-containing protein n=1 Tax=Actimicrobium sp. CCC2.4 TaxID=3048606 RepID=UPI002AC9A1AB|nr:secretin N-terminal domain-containing protein [Actimicrobium sp. CCC2.4]MEB0134708.1 secretin N-terminal domain-containing protein [Actimicrobium sp. CCC2.4]WPX30651.1 secretin N-terminal domain-containing protein [Actimicrobium sp. CCC2.4]